ARPMARSLGDRRGGTGIFLISILIFGKRFWSYSVSWYRIAKGARFYPAAGNQSILAMWDRIIGRRLIPFVSPAVNPVHWTGNPLVRIAWAITVLALLGGVQLAFASPLSEGFASSVLEWSVIFLFSAMIGPVTWAHYLVVILLPSYFL